MSPVQCSVSAMHPRPRTASTGGIGGNIVPSAIFIGIFGPLVDIGIGTKSRSFRCFMHSTSFVNNMLLIEKLFVELNYITDCNTLL